MLTTQEIENTDDLKSVKPQFVFMGTVYSDEIAFYKMVRKSC